MTDTTDKACECTRDLKLRLRQTAQILIEEIGAEGPTNAETAAANAVQLIRNLKAELATLRAKMER